MTRELASPCRLYCGECRAIVDGTCNGCRSSQGLCLKYREVCGVYSCAESGGVKFCFECADFPCIKFRDFFETPAWYEEVIGNLKRMKEIGVEKWVAEQEERVKVLERCAADRGVKHCSECGGWPCDKLPRPPLTPD